MVVEFPIDDSVSFTQTILTASSSSTVWGPGALAGKMFKAFGEKGLDILCNIVIRRRLAYIRQTISKKPHIFNNPMDANEYQQMNEIYSDLKELCKESYSLPLRRAATELITDIIILIRTPDATAYNDEALGMQWALLLSHPQYLRGVLFRSHRPSTAFARIIMADSSFNQNPEISHVTSIAFVNPPIVPRDNHSVFITKTVEVQTSKDDDQYRVQHPKVLVLGAGGVGKSTLIKQITTGNRREQAADFETYREVIRNNLIASMESILRTTHRIGTSDSWEPGPVTNATELMTTLWKYEHVDDQSTQDVCHGIRPFWSLPEVRDLARQPGVPGQWEAAHDSASFLFDSVDRIFSSDYTPTHEDVVRSRVRTIGLHEVTEEQGPSTWRIIDTGGARSERRKWKHSFEDVTAMLFVVALCDYNRVLYEDPSENGMDDSLQLFEHIVNMSCFEKTLILLLFTKTDVFADELKHAPLKDWTVARSRMPAYDGSTYDDACQYIEDRYTELLKDKDRPVHIQYICTVDTTAMHEQCIAIRNHVNQYYEQQRISLQESG